MKYKLIATDMDGTLLTDEHKISKENENAIVEIQKKGVKFVLASGRPSYAMYEYAKQLQMDKLGGYILSFNGGQLIDFSTDTLIFHEGLNKEDIVKIYEASKKIGLPMVLYSKDTVWGSADTPNVRFEAQLCTMKLKIFNKLEELFENNIYETTKCMLIGEEEEVKKAEVYMKEKYENDYFMATSKPIFLEIANKNVNKGKTLKKLGEILNITLEEMIASGDGANDLPLLEVVGMPVAVENAIEEVKKISKFESTTNNNHALKTVIEHFFE